MCESRYSLSIIQRGKSWWVEVWDSQFARQSEILVQRFPNRKQALVYADGFLDATIDHLDN